jgi:hypothetical protein
MFPHRGGGEQACRWCCVVAGRCDAKLGRPYSTGDLWMHAECGTSWWARCQSHRIQEPRQSDCNCHAARPAHGRRLTRADSRGALREPRTTRQDGGSRCHQASRRRVLAPSPCPIPHFLLLGIPITTREHVPSAPGDHSCTSCTAPAPFVWSPLSRHHAAALVQSPADATPGHPLPSLLWLAAQPGHPARGEPRGERAHSAARGREAPARTAHCPHDLCDGTAVLSLSIAQE